MIRVRPYSLVALAVVLGVAIHATAFAQGQLPDGAGKDVAMRLCGTCHEPERAASVRLTHEGWEGELSKMVDLGMKATDDELKQLLDYFSERFKGEASKPINMNAATAIELESVVGLMKKEAAAWIAYRAKTPCKTLDDLKKVPEVPFKKIEDRRDRLVCGVPPEK